MSRVARPAPAPVPDLARCLGGVLLLGALVFPGSVRAAGGSSGAGGATPPPSSTENRRVQNDTTQEPIMAQRVLPASVQLEGHVHTLANEPLAGLRVRLFSNGVALETVTTDADGAFLITANPPAGENNTSDLWIESPDPEKYIDVNVLLAAGRVAREQRLYSACTPEVKVTASGAAVEVTMFSIDEKKNALVQSKCLETEP